MRDVLENNLELDPDLAEQLIPFTADYTHNLVTIFDKDDLVDTHHWNHAETISEVYKKTKKI